MTVAGASVAAVAGCGTVDWYPSDTTPDEHVLRSLLREKERMLVRYEHALVEGSGPSDLLARVSENHRTHLDALTEALPEDAEPTPPTEEGSPEPVPADEDPDLAEAPSPAALRAMEAAAAGARSDQAAAVTDRGLAQLIGSVGACEAGHAYLLDDA
ncbi:hypothetical protein [Nocardiopsis xinjiangensis]|uniref:hypothetical protein n=1 Tax=Nocardiopsis xinjiangensis TaxID=124285 RepID=UPI000375E76C|nr:hypothetical protein [Nocardiopsis xinjiangensis]